MPEATVTAHPHELIAQRDARIRDLENILSAARDYATTEIASRELEIRDLERLVTHLERQAEARSQETEALQDALSQVQAWCKAYPVKQFPEPRWNAVRHALQVEGISLDAVSASNMRHICDGIARILEASLPKEGQNCDD